MGRPILRTELKGQKQSHMGIQYKIKTFQFSGENTVYPLKGVRIPMQLFVGKKLSCIHTVYQNPVLNENTEVLKVLEKIMGES